MAFDSLRTRIRNLRDKDQDDAQDQAENLPVAVEEPESAEVAKLNERFRTTWAEATSKEVGGDKLSTFVLGALDKAVGVQAGTIVRYVDGVKMRSPNASLAERQEDIDGHFLNLVTGTGATAGGASAIPGIGFATGTAAIAGESVVFLEAAAWYILASANLHGIDIKDKELRRALVLMILSGSRGTAVVDTFFGEAGTVNAGMDSVQALSRFSMPTLQGVNARLARTFTKQVTKRFKWAWVSKLMPLGIGAVMGGIANRKLARVVIDNAHDQLAGLRG